MFVKNGEKNAIVDPYYHVVYIYIYICVCGCVGVCACLCMWPCIYIYIWRERERERERVFQFCRIIYKKNRVGMVQRYSSVNC